MLFRQGKRIHGHQPKRGSIRIHLPPQCVPLEMRAGQLLHQRTRGVQERIVLDTGGCRKVETKRTEIIEPGGLIFPLKL